MPIHISMITKCEKESKRAHVLFWSHRGGELASGKDEAVEGDLQVKRALSGQILRAYALQSHHTQTTRKRYAPQLR